MQWPCKRVEDELVSMKDILRQIYTAMDTKTTIWSSICVYCDPSAAKHSVVVKSDHLNGSPLAGTEACGLVFTFFVYIVNLNGKMDELE